MGAKIIKDFTISPRIALMLHYAQIPIGFQRKHPERVKRPRKRVSGLWEENKHLVRPKVIYQFFDYTIEDERLFLYRKGILYAFLRIIRKVRKKKLEDGVFQSSYLVKNIKKSNPPEVALFVVTIGKEIIEKIDEYSQSTSILGSLDSLYLEGIGSEAVEATARYLCQFLAKRMGHGKSLKRLSPGWGEQKGFDWKLKDQKILFELLDREKIKEGLEVELLEYPEAESFMMVPRKTVSAIAFPVSGKASDQTRNQGE